MKTPLYASIACNLDQALLSAALPLLEDGKVDAIEWSFDALYRHVEIPDWFGELIQAFASEERLVGHGVFFSIFSGAWLPGQQEWLRQLAALSDVYRFDHITEHFGFMTGADFHKGAPLSIPYTASTVAIGHDRLLRIGDAGRCPVGLENLAFAYSLDEVRRQGDFLEKLVTPVNGFIILDLHNLYCQIHNFELDAETLLQSYPLHLVREIHISGGSWADHPMANRGKIRRDTHDDAVPEEVFALLRYVIDKCPHLKFVVMEQLSSALTTEASHKQFRDDFDKMRAIIGVCTGKYADDYRDPFKSSQMRAFILPEHPLEDLSLHQQQQELSDILETSVNYREAIQRLQNSSLANSAWDIRNWKPYMLETALAIAQKWQA